MTDEQIEQFLDKPESEPVSPELTQARAQRDVLGNAAAHWIGRYFALKAAYGELDVRAVAPLVQREVQALEATADVPAQP